MFIYAPSPEAEYAPVFGQLTLEQIGLFERRLSAQVPAVRFVILEEERIHPTVERFILKLHRDDRDRAMAAVQEIVDQIVPLLFPRIKVHDRNIATLIRQLWRAHEADDQIAIRLMKEYLCSELGAIVERLLMKIHRDGAVDLRLDGIGAQEVSFVPPFGLKIIGYIYVGRGSDLFNCGRRPFEAELGASDDSSALERFNVRFGDLAHLTSATVIKADATDSYSYDDTVFSVRVGRSVPHQAGQLVEWAFEIAKSVTSTGDVTPYERQRRR